MSNKAVFAKNLKKYMDLHGKTRRDISEVLGISYYTVSDWVNGKKYPRMDKVELLANYFGIQKSDLIEEKMTDEGKKNSDAIVGITKELFTNDKLCAVVYYLCMADLDEVRLDNVMEFIEFQAKR